MAEVKVLGHIYNNILKGIKLGKSLIALQGSARCFAPGTLVRMADGRLKAIEQIRVGDAVMNITGDGYNTVTEVHSGLDMMYKIVQHKGEDYVVNSQHILSLKQTQPFITHGYNRERKKIPFNKEAILDMPICNYLVQSKNFKVNFCGFKIDKAIQLPKQDLKIDPYYLGMWLGDGDSKAWHAITNIDKEVLDWFYAFAGSLDTNAERIDDVRHKIVVRGRGRGDGKVNDKVSAMFEGFKHYNLLNNKHVPDEYIYGDYEDRLKLLAGLIDSDGTNTGRNTISISQKNRGILEATLEICRLSGFYTNGIREKISTMKRDDGSIYRCKTYFIDFNHKDFKDLNKYILVPRKRIENKNCERNYFVSSFEIEELGLGEYFGFSLDNDPHFLLADGTVVHNSGKTRNTMIFLILCCQKKPNLHVSVVRASLPALKRSVYRDDFVEVMTQMGQFELNRMNKTEMTYTFQNGSIMEFFATNGPEGAQKVRGPGRDILFCNEANEIEEENFKQLRMRTRMFSIIDFNPSFTEEHWIYRILNDERTFYFKSTFADNIFLPDPIKEEILSYKTTNPALWRIFGEGEFAIIEGLVFDKNSWDTCKLEDIPIDIKESRIGIDFGYSTDPTAAVRVWTKTIHGERHMWVHQLLYDRGLKTKQIAARMKPWNEIPKFCENADPRLIDELEDEGMTMMYKTKKYPGSLIVGIQKMQGYHIHITKQSTELMKEMRNYCFQKDRHDNYLNVPIDKFNHAIDALRYAVTDDRLNPGGKKVFYTKDELGLDF